MPLVIICLVELTTGIISACVPALGPLIYRFVHDRAAPKARKPSSYRFPIKDAGYRVEVVRKGSNESWSDMGTNSGLEAGEVMHPYERS